MGFVSPRCRSVTRRGERRADRKVWRRAWRDVSRSSRRETWRRVLPPGPTLRTICAMLNTYIRMRLRFEKKWNPPSKLKTWSPPAHSDTFEADLKRVYGDAACATQESQACPAGKEVVTAQEPGPAPPSPAPGQDASRHPGPDPADEKQDLTAVPLGYSPEGLFCLRWDLVKPRNRTKP